MTKDLAFPGPEVPVIDETRLTAEFGSDPEILADHCVGSLMGFMGYARSPAPREAVRNHVKGILGFLDAIALPPQQNRT